MNSETLKITYLISLLNVVIVQPIDKMVCQWTKWPWGAPRGILSINKMALGGCSTTARPIIPVAPTTKMQRLATCVGVGGAFSKLPTAPGVGQPGQTSSRLLSVR